MGLEGLDPCQDRTRRPGTPRFDSVQVHVKIRYALAAAAAVAGLSQAGTAYASPAAPSPWRYVWLTAQGGGGCATYKAAVNLEPITSAPCASSAGFWFRDLSRSGEWEAGDHLEFATASGAYAIGYSGGRFRLEKPDTSRTYFVVATNPDYSYRFVILADAGDSVAMVPNGSGKDVQAPGLSEVGLPPDGWTACSTGVPYCATGGMLT